MKKTLIVLMFAFIFAPVAHADVATSTDATSTDSTIASSTDTTVDTATSTEDTATSTDTTIATSTDATSTSTTDTATSTDDTATSTATTPVVAAISAPAGGIMVGATAPFMFNGKLYQPMISAPVVTVAPVVPEAPVSVQETTVQFSSNLRFGMKSNDVLALQKVLGMDLQTGYFGPLTKAAVVKYQAENNLPATGFVGPLTRSILNQ